MRTICRRHILKAQGRLPPCRQRLMMHKYLRARPRDIDAWEEMADLAAYAGERKYMAVVGKQLLRLSNEAGAPRSRAITVSTLALDLQQAEAAADDQRNAIVRRRCHGGDAQQHEDGK